MHPGELFLGGVDRFKTDTGIDLSVVETGIRSAGHDIRNDLNTREDLVDGFLRHLKLRSLEIQ